MGITGVYIAIQPEGLDTARVTATGIFGFDGNRAGCLAIGGNVGKLGHATVNGVSVAALVNIHHTNRTTGRSELIQEFVEREAATGCRRCRETQ